MISHLSEISSETLTISYYVLWPTNMKEKGFIGKKTIFSPIAGAYIQTWELSTERNPQRNIDQKAGEPPGSLTGEKSQEKKEKEEERADGGGEWFKPVAGLLKLLRKFGKVSENNLQIILENIRYYLREL